MQVDKCISAENAKFIWNIRILAICIDENNVSLLVKLTGNYRCIMFSKNVCMVTFFSHDRVSIKHDPAA